MKNIFELETVDDETLQNAIKQGKYNRAILTKIFNNVTPQIKTQLNQIIQNQDDISLINKLSVATLGNLLIFNLDEWGPWEYPKLGDKLFSFDSSISWRTKNNDFLSSMPLIGYDCYGFSNKMRVEVWLMIDELKMKRLDFELTTDKENNIVYIQICKRIRPSFDGEWSKQKNRFKMFDVASQDKIIKEVFPELEKMKFKVKLDDVL